MTGSVFRNLSISPTPDPITASQEKNESNLQVGNSTVESTTLAIASSLDKQLPVQGNSGNCNVEEVARQLIKVAESDILSAGTIDCMTSINQKMQQILGSGAEFLSMYQCLQSTLNSLLKRVDMIQCMYKKNEISLEQSEQFMVRIKDLYEKLHEYLILVEAIKDKNAMKKDTLEELSTPINQQSIDQAMKVFKEACKYIGETCVPLLDDDIAKAKAKHKAGALSLQNNYSKCIKFINDIFDDFM